ncbi:unnamed protein product [Closterium sp. NIES-65]|nr:unnamed protein product [Closterium sp. NIES-65]
MVAREQATEVQEGACNGMTVQEGACNGMTVREGACNGMTVQEGACNGMTVQDGACNGMTVQEDACNGLTVQDGAFNEVTAQEGSAIASGAGAEGTLFRALEAEEVRRQGHRMVEFIADYLQGVGDRPVCSTVQPGYLRPLLPAHAPEHGEPLDAILSDHARSLSPPSVFRRLGPTCISHLAILPGLTHWQSPAFFTFFSSPTSAAAICADALISALNVVGFSWAAAPAATELEEVVMVWMVELLGLPDGFHSVKSGGQGGGVIHGTASEALLAARRRVLDRVVGQAGSVEEAAADSAAAAAGSRQGAQEENRAAEGRLIAHLNEEESRLIWRIVSSRNGRQGCNGSVGVAHEEWPADAAGDGDGDGSGACVFGTTSSTGAGAGQAGSTSGGAAAASKAAAGACEQGEAAGAPWGSAEDRAAHCLVAYVSDQTHACALKACRVAGIPEGNVRVLPTTAASAYALTARQLLDAVQRDEAAGIIPFFLVLTVSGRCLVLLFLALIVSGSCIGTYPLSPPRLPSSATTCTGTWHVDAAYAGMACMCAEMRHHLTGVHLADSLASNAHKWLLTSFDCCCMWMQVRAASGRGGGKPGSAGGRGGALRSGCRQEVCMVAVVLLGQQASGESTVHTAGIPAEQVLLQYALITASENHHVVDYKDWEIPIGRRFRCAPPLPSCTCPPQLHAVGLSLKLWMVLRTYGADGIRAYIRRHVALAEWFEEAVRQDDRFQLMAPRPFALVCFRLKPPAARTHSGVPCGGGDEGVMGDGSEDAGRKVNAALLEAINSSGQAYLTHTVLSGQYTLRMAIRAVKTEMAHVQAAWRLIQTKASELLEEVKFTRKKQNKPATVRDATAG